MTREHLKEIYLCLSSLPLEQELNPELYEARQELKKELERRIFDIADQITQDVDSILKDQHKIVLPSSSLDILRTTLSRIL